MEIIDLNFNEQNHTKEVLSHLKNQVFHLTSLKVSESIKKMGRILNSNNGNCKPIWNSNNNFARIHNYICLLDLRNATDDIIDSILIKYNFLTPSFFEEYHEPYFISDLAYFILNEKYYSKIIPNDAALSYAKESGHNSNYIPKTECWFAHELPIEYINKLLLVHLKRKVKPNNLADQIIISKFKRNGNIK